MVYGIGIDMIEVKRIEKQISAGPRFVERIFTSREVDYCERKKNKAQNYAARFAAKEAFLKAVGTGWRKGLAFKEIEVINDELGKPEIMLYGKAKKFAEERKIVNIQVSITHLKENASAIVTLET